VIGGGDTKRTSPGGPTSPLSPFSPLGPGGPGFPVIPCIPGFPVGGTLIQWQPKWASLQNYNDD